MDPCHGQVQCDVCFSIFLSQGFLGRSDSQNRKPVRHKNLEKAECSQVDHGGGGYPGFHMAQFHGGGGYPGFHMAQLSM